MPSNETVKDSNSDKTWITSARTTFMLGCMTGVTVFGAASLMRRCVSSFHSPPTPTTKSDDTDSSAGNIKNDIDSKSKSPEIARQQQQTIDHDPVDDNNDGDTLLPLLSKDAVYEKLDSSTKVSRTFCYQSVPDPHIAFVTAINLLVEYLPNAILHILFSFLPPPPDDQHLQQQWMSSSAASSNNNNLDEYLWNGWESNNAVLHDTPDLYVENVLPIKNQPSMIITIGLPGSGKTTWAKVRLTNALQAQAQNVIAADDYFDRYHDGQFEASQLGNAHEWAQNAITHALQCGQSVVVNNTNTTLSEMHFYVCQVVFSNLPHKIVFAVMPELKLHICAQRGVHGVTLKKLREMRTRMQRWLVQRPPSIASVLRAGPFTRRYWGRDRPAKHVVYTGVFIQDMASMARIRQYFVGVSNCRSLLPHLTDCHLTLKFKPLQSDMQRLPFGKRVALKIVAYATHPHLQTLLVDILDPSVRALCTNRYPHITVACNRHRVGAQYSNELLANGKVIPVVNQFDVDAVDTNEYQQRYRHNSEQHGGLIVHGTVGACYSYPEFGVYFEPPPMPIESDTTAGMRNQSSRRGRYQQQQRTASAPNVKVNVKQKQWRSSREKQSSQQSYSNATQDVRSSTTANQQDELPVAFTAMRFKQLMEEKIATKQNETRRSYKLQPQQKTENNNQNSDNNNVSKKKNRRRKKKEYTVKKIDGHQKSKAPGIADNTVEQEEEREERQQEEEDVNMNDIVIINKNENSNDENSQNAEVKPNNDKDKSERQLLSESGKEDAPSDDRVDASSEVHVHADNDSNNNQNLNIIAKDEDSNSMLANNE